MNVLVVSPTIPFPPIGGGNLRTFHLLRALAARHEVTLVGFDVPGMESSDPPFPLRIVRVPWEEPELYRRISAGGPDWEEAYEALATGELPWIASCYEVPAMAEALRGLGDTEFDLCMVEHSLLAQYLPALPAGVPKILDLHNIHTLMAQREAARKADDEKAEREIARVLKFEKRVCAEADLCLVCSAAEAKAAEELLGVRHAAVVPNGVDASHFKPSTKEPVPGYLLFTGLMNYEPNAEAVLYFAQEILPQIIAERPDVQFHVVGANPSEPVRQLACNHLTVHGSVKETHSYFQNAEVVVVPLLHGGGTRLKILEAAANGKAIVSTSLGAEGLDFVDERDLLIADAPQEFAKVVLDLLSNPEKRRMLEKNSRAASLKYDWSEVTHYFDQLVDNCLRK